ncbi:hypothetical protein JCM14076_14790 [Methylosoma difficile]
MKKSLTTLAIVTCALSQGVFAHTGVKDTITAGTSTIYNAFTATHGCASNVGGEGSGTSQDLVGASVVFPNGAGSPVNKIDSAGNTIEAIDLSTVLAGGVTGGVWTGMGPRAIFPSLFNNQKAVFDAAGNLRGFYTYGGSKQGGTSVVGLIPFRMSAVQFKADASGAINCAKSLKVRMAVANWCKRGAVNDAADDRADFWIGHMTTKFNDPETMPYNATDVAAGKFYWPTMTINRDLTAQPLDASCGAGFDVAIEPSDADIDAYLPIPSTVTPTFWPGN